MADLSKIVPQLLSFVSFLFGARGPSAIFGTIGTVYVDPVERFAFGTQAHIRNKILQRINPTLANPNSPTSIIRVFFAVFGVASSSHFDPASCGSAIREAMLGYFRPGNVFSSRVRTSRAATGFSRTDIGKDNGTLKPAIAPAKTALPARFE